MLIVKYSVKDENVKYHHLSCTMHRRTIMYNSNKICNIEMKYKIIIGLLGMERTQWQRPHFAKTNPESWQRTIYLWLYRTLAIAALGFVDRNRCGPGCDGCRDSRYGGCVAPGQWPSRPSVPWRGRRPSQGWHDIYRHNISDIFTRKYRIYIKYLSMIFWG